MRFVSSNSYYEWQDGPLAHELRRPISSMDRFLWQLLRAVSNSSSIGNIMRKRGIGTPSSAPQPTPNSNRTPTD